MDSWESTAGDAAFLRCLVGAPEGRHCSLIESHSDSGSTWKDKI